jgi:hypothetical protein
MTRNETFAILASPCDGIAFVFDGPQFPEPEVVTFHGTGTCPDADAHHPASPPEGWRPDGRR